MSLFAGNAGKFCRIYIYICVCVCVCVGLKNMSYDNTIYIYLYTCVCVNVCADFSISTNIYIYI